MPRRSPPIRDVTVRGFTVPTDAPEADGTFRWDRTHVTLVEIEAGGMRGLGYTYGAPGLDDLVERLLKPVILDADAFALPRHLEAMRAAVRNVGRPGIAATAISAVDTALWDLKARLLDVPLAVLFGAARDAVPIYGSGGFTSYDDERTLDQFRGWIEEFGCDAVKMKIGHEPAREVARVRRIRERLPETALMIDANGAYGRKPALRLAERVAELGVTWFEEPVSGDDLAGLRMLRDRFPSRLELAAGEYAYEPRDVARMVSAGAVDVIQIDATRCCGFTGFLEAAVIAREHGVPVSAHTAPALHLHVCCAPADLRHIEWFHDHARVEAMLFEGAPRPADGRIRPDLGRPGNGLSVRERDAARFAA